MHAPEVISVLYGNGSDPREKDNRIQNPLKVDSIALTTPFSHNYYPLPLFSLTGALLRSQPDLHQITLRKSGDPNEIMSLVQQEHPDVLALSAPQGTKQTLVETLTALGEMKPEDRPHLILGGSLPTYLHGMLFDRHHNLPMTIIGSWGEEPFAREVLGVSLGDNVPEQKFIVGKYPETYPKQEGIPPKGTVVFHYPRVEASKGCFWGACSYCLRPLDEKRGDWKQYDPEDVVKQVEELLKLGYTGYLEFADEEPVGNDIERFGKIFDDLAKLKKDYPAFSFGINMRADHVISPDPSKQNKYDQFLDKGIRAGLSNVWMGAESYSHRQLQVLRKGNSIEPAINLEAAQKLYDRGINVLQGFIPYHPLSTWSELNEMAEFMEPHLGFLSKVISSPYGFLRVQYNTPYLDTIKRYDNTASSPLLGDLDENMLAFNCKYRDPSIGLHVAYMRLVYDWINPRMKQMNVEALKGDKGSQERLEKIRYAGLKLFINSIKHTEPVNDDPEAIRREQMRTIVEFKKEIGEVGFDITELDDFIAHNLADYTALFVWN